jgi:hypothetical protein
MRTTIRDAALACAFAMTFGATYAAPQSTLASPQRLDSAEVRSWREDLAYMVREMERRHRNLYHTVSRAAFDSAVAGLERRIPSLARHQIIVEMARVAALVGDGHTNIAPTRDPKIGFQVLPLRLYFFKDGLFVRAADRAHTHLTGARVVKIGRATSEEALARVQEIIGRDNEMGARFFAPFLLAMPEVLHALGIIPAVNEATLVLESEGREMAVTLRAWGPAPMMPPDTDVSWWPDSAWVDMRDQAQKPVPLWLSRDPNTHFWFEYIPASRLVYVQYNKVGNMPQETIAEFSRRLLAFLDTAAVDRLVLDLRLNRGGDGTLNPPLLASLIKARRLNGPGKLFAIVGRGTFSAAQFLVNELEQYTDAVFVGEPTGGKVNSYGDSRKIVLPHSGLTVRVSTLWWQEDPRDLRPWTAPDIAAELTSSDYRNNVDPAYQAVLAYTPERPLAEGMADALAAGGMDAVLRRYRDYRRDPRHAFADTEAEVNTFGYQLIERGRFADAIRIMELNVREYPRSANTYDSLAEAYMRAGQKEAAIRNYRTSLSLDPRNQNARAMLEQLER